MKHHFFGARGTSGFATPTVNQCITFLFDAAVEEDLTVKSSCDHLPYVYLQKTAFT